ncbi:anti-FecI sigma factor, FecR [Fibrisoma limi BUZ 3]|uniref:Anti-FecI sigma factor, FecR n=1 Tax=Fibrisoma limi BUZ 3 TaxID=1185876 RepID=I2GE84_9BACT|nr:FecR domain-containing protein [Fibrisoma limi]CCH52209.1 anti-FecI sigma factor, FecR [Fibrisoma limi BUZ 3]
MNESIDWELLGRIFANEATEDERRAFNEWLKANPESQPLVDALRQHWQASPPTESSLATSVAFNQVWGRIEAEEETGTAVRRIGQRSWLGWVAAASVVLVGLVIGWNVYQSRSVEPTLVQQANPKGTRSKIHLADGSTVWLNADSRLNYPKTFTGALREVSLEGEAFFQVAHNPKQPFVVRLKTGSVRVLGTSFNIRAYPGDSIVETSVVTGKVAFIPKQPARKRADLRAEQTIQPVSDTLFLTPNLKAVQSLTSRQVMTQSTVAANQIAWTESKLVFRNTPLGEVAKTLERWYGTPVSLEHESLRQCPLTGTFQNQSLKEVMNLIAMTKRFDYELTESRLTIKGPGCE